MSDENTKGALPPEKLDRIIKLVDPRGSQSDKDKIKQEIVDENRQALKAITPKAN